MRTAEQTPDRSRTATPLLNAAYDVETRIGAAVEALADCYCGNPGDPGLRHRLTGAINALEWAYRNYVRHFTALDLEMPPEVHAQMRRRALEIKKRRKGETMDEELLKRVLDGLRKLDSEGESGT